MLDALRSLVLWTPLGPPAFLFVIPLVVFFHELGHFLVARACGVKVDVFSVGFGKEIFGWNDKSGTRWKVSWLPIGGYVKFAGDANAASIPDRAAEWGSSLAGLSWKDSCCLRPGPPRSLLPLSRNPPKLQR